MNQKDQKNKIHEADRNKRRPAFVVNGKSGKQPKTLKKRREFLKISASGERFVTKGFILQIGEKQKNLTNSTSFGYTTSKKVGNAVERNRVRRQLREIARLVLANKIEDGRDFVLVGRRNALDLPFSKLVKDALWALKKMGLNKEA